MRDIRPFDEKKLQMMCDEQNASPDECLAYDEQLGKSCHPVAGREALERARNAVTMRWKNARFPITDGPYAESKEQFGRIRRVRSG